MLTELRAAMVSGPAAACNCGVWPCLGQRLLFCTSKFADLLQKNCKQANLLLKSERVNKAYQASDRVCSMFRHTLNPFDNEAARITRVPATAARPPR